MKTRDLFARFSCLLLASFCAFAQETSTAGEILEHYENYKEPSLKERRINYDDIAPLLEKWSSQPELKVQKVGESIEGRPLSLVSLGEGQVDVFLWSQMHGDESTATMAIFDLLNFFAHDSFTAEKNFLLENLKLHFLPMLNPDGAERFQRRNALGIDLNRDALRLQSPEARTLKRIRDSLDADFGFNLHDQSRYYNAEGTDRPATISFLAPAYDYEKSVNDVRGAAMQLIVQMNAELQKYIPGQVARYNDDFEPRAFGDNIQKWGTTTILVESGGYHGDPEKQEIRKFNFLAILAALFSIADKSYAKINIHDYEKIPHNDTQLYDLKLTGLEYQLRGETFLLDLAINHHEIPTNEDKGFYYHSKVADQGGLSTSFGYESRDFSGYRIIPGAVYPETFADLEALETADFSEILKSGFTHVRVEKLPTGKNFTLHPVQVVSTNYRLRQDLHPGVNPSFFLEKDGKLEYALINGFLISLENPEDDFRNSLILR